MTAKGTIERHFSQTALVWRDRIYKSRPLQRAWEYFDKQYRFDSVAGMAPRARRPGARALDIGCGAGQMIPVLRSLGYEVAANDISENMVSLARELCARAGVQADVRTGDCERLPQPADCLDLVVAMGVIEYLDEDGPMLEEIRRVLRPGGAAIVTFRNVRCVHIRWRGVVQRLERALRGGGLPAISREHDPRRVRAALLSLGFRPLAERYVHYHALPSPLERVLPRLEALLGKSMERLFSGLGVPRLASTYIVKFEKPAVG